MTDNKTFNFFSGQQDLPLDKMLENASEKIQGAEKKDLYNIFDSKDKDIEMIKFRQKDLAYQRKMTIIKMRKRKNQMILVRRLLKRMIKEKMERKKKMKLQITNLLISIIFLLII